MTIESDLNRIANALEAIASTITQETVTPVAFNTVKPAETPAPVAPVAQAPAPAAPATVTPMFQQPAAPATPAPAAQPTGTVLPFKDVPGLVSYTMGAYHELGAEKGSRIQGVLTGLGYDNINNVKPEHFNQFYNQIEALKAGG